MAGLAGGLLALGSLGRTGGFLQRFLRSFTAKGGASADGKPFLTGLSLGFLLTVPLSAIPYRWTVLAAGLVLALAGAVLMILRSGKKEGVPA